MQWVWLLMQKKTNTASGQSNNQSQLLGEYWVYQSYTMPNLQHSSKNIYTLRKLLCILL
jgi:hypothetical protein